MAKRDPEAQLDMFPQKAEIAGLGITKIEIRGSEISGVLAGVINTNDVAQVNDECWKAAIAEWLFKLMLCHSEDTKALIDQVEKRMTLLEEAADEAARHEMMRDKDKTSVVKFR